MLSKIMLPFIMSQILTYFNLELEFKNTEFAIKNKLKKSFKSILTLIL